MEDLVTARQSPDPSRSASARACRRVTDWSFTDRPARRARRGRRCWSSTLVLSLDPAMRGWMNEGKQLHRAGRHRRRDARRRRGHRGGVAQSPVIPTKAIMSPVRDRACRNTGQVSEKQVARGDVCRRSTCGSARVEQWLNVLGMPGMTAYFGLLDGRRSAEGGRDRRRVGRRRRGGPDRGPAREDPGMPRRWGSRAGRPSAGGSSTNSASMRASTTRSEDVKAALKQHCPKGVDIYFDNVGAATSSIRGPRTDRVAMRAIIICGAISQYNNTGAVSRARPTTSRCSSIARGCRASWYSTTRARFHARRQSSSPAISKDGRLKSREDVVDGPRHVPRGVAQAVPRRQLRQARCCASRKRPERFSFLCPSSHPVNILNIRFRPDHVSAFAAQRSNSRSDTSPCSTRYRCIVERGGRIGLIGRNGAGKSSLLSLIAGQRASPTTATSPARPGLTVALVEQEPALAGGRSRSSRPSRAGLPAAAHIVAYERAAHRRRDRSLRRGDERARRPAIRPHSTPTTAGPPRIALNA